MSLVHIKEWDDMKTCPYDPSHRVTAIKFAGHLMKCKRNYQVKLRACPFNAQHMVSEAEYVCHVESCPDRVTTEREIVARRLNARVSSEPKDYNYGLPTPAEDWDAECRDANYGTYDPSEAMRRATFRNPATLSSMKRAEKKEFHKKLLEESRSGDPTPSSSPMTSTKDKFEKLRLPKDLDKYNPKIELARGRPISQAASTSSSPAFFAWRGRGRGLFQTADENSRRPGSRSSTMFDCDSEVSDHVPGSFVEDYFSDASEAMDRLRL